MATSGVRTCVARTHIHIRALARMYTCKYRLHVRLTFGKKELWCAQIRSKLAPGPLPGSKLTRFSSCVRPWRRGAPPEGQKAAHQRPPPRKVTLTRRRTCLSTVPLSIRRSPRDIRRLDLWCSGPGPPRPLDPSTGLALRSGSPKRGQCQTRTLARQRNQQRGPLVPWFLEAARSRKVQD